MRIWKLIPTNLDDPIWKKWNPEPIIVRAESECGARHLAVLATVKTFPPIRYAPIAVNPWAVIRRSAIPRQRSVKTSPIALPSSQSTAPPRCYGTEKISNNPVVYR